MFIISITNYQFRSKNIIQYKTNQFNVINTKLLWNNKYFVLKYVIIDWIKLNKKSFYLSGPRTNSFVPRLFYLSYVSTVKMTRRNKEYLKNINRIIFQTNSKRSILWPVWQVLIRSCKWNESWPDIYSLIFCSIL